MGVSSGHHRRDDEQAILIALFRYGVIAPLVEPERFAPGDKSRLVAELAKQQHFLPGKGAVTVSERTIWAWQAAYRAGGLEQLTPKWRSDRGKSRVIDEAIVQRAVQLRRENSERWTSTVLDLLKREGAFAQKAIPHRATLDRHLRAQGASRRQLKVLGQKVHIKMVFKRFGDLWVGDYHHGPLVLGPSGKPTLAKLGAFIDHCSRYPVADRYYPAEDIATLRDTMLRAFMSFGLPVKVYVDRGAVYRAEQLRYSLDRVGTHLVHSKEYTSEGRGVIERWWQNIKQFEHEVRLHEGLYTLHELNRLWEAYRQLRYCDEVHSEIGMTPQEAIAEVKGRSVDPQVLRELFLVREDRTVHKKDSCVQLFGKRYLCDRALRGQRVQVRFDPSEMSSVLIFRDKQRLCRALPQKVNAVPEPHPESPQAPPPSVDYLALLRRDYDRQLLEHAKPLAYVQMTVEPTFDAETFIRVVTRLAGLADHAAGRRELSAFFETFGPFPEELCRIGVEHAVRLHGRGRHEQVYLHSIRTLVLAHWKTPQQERP